MEKKVPLWQEKGARTLQVGPGAWPVVLRTLRVVGAFPVPRGAAPRCPARPRAGARLSLEESRRKEHQGGRGSSSLDPPFLVGGTLVGSLFFSAWPAALYLTSVTARPPAGRAGGGGFSDGKGSSHPQSLPLGGRWAGEAGSDEGAILYPTFPCRKGGSPGRRPNGFLLLPRWATRSPPHQSPSVTASPQGEASGLCSPTRKKRPKSGHVDGPRNRRTTRTMWHPTPKRASGNERAIKPGVQGACPRPSSPHFSGEMGTPPGRRAPGALRPEAPEKP